MSFPSICRPAVCVAALSLAAWRIGACGPGVNQAWTAPGWYLEKPYLTRARRTEVLRRALLLRQVRGGAHQAAGGNGHPDGVRAGKPQTGTLRPLLILISADRHQAGIAAGRRRVDAERYLVEQEVARIGLDMDRHDAARPLRQAAIEGNKVFRGCRRTAPPQCPRSASCGGDAIAGRAAPVRAAPCSLPQIAARRTGPRPWAEAHRVALAHRTGQFAGHGDRSSGGRCDSRRRT